MAALGTIFFTSLLVAFSGAMMPGPLLSVTISESARRGPAAGPLLMVGHALLELALVVALLFGLSPVLEHDLFFVVTALAGGAIMLRMARGMFKSLPTLSFRTVPEGDGARNLFLSGALMSIANPYWTIWWATIGLGYVLHSRAFGVAGVALFFVGHIAADFIWYAAVSTAVGKGKKLVSDRVYRVLIGACAVFLAGFALVVVVSGMGRLLG